MQATPYLVIEGTVVGSRTVELPARQPEEYTDRRTGEMKMTRGSNASSYREVAVNAPAILDGEVVPELRAVLTVRWPERGDMPDEGTEVRWALEAAQVKVWMRGGFREWIVYHYRGEAPAGAAALTSTRSRLAPTGT